MLSSSTVGIGHTSMTSPHGSSSSFTAMYIYKPVFYKYTITKSKYFIYTIYPINKFLVQYLRSTKFITDALFLIIFYIQYLFIKYYCFSSLEAFNFTIFLCSRSLFCLFFIYCAPVSSVNFIILIA